MSASLPSPALAVGVDIVAIRRVQGALDNHPEKFCQRVLNSRECLQYNTLPPRLRAAWLAKRFAAKEAVMKALGTGLASGVRFHDVQISTLPSGQPRVDLFDRAWRRLRDLRGSEILLSISDEAGLAVAFAMIV